MKRMHLILLLAIVASFITACKEDDPDPTVVGYWTGTYNGSSPFAALFRSNGTVRIYSNDADTASSDIAEGTYTVTDSVRATYDYGGSDIYSFAGKLNDAVTSMTGTWGEGTSTTGGGVFTMSR